MEIRSPGDETDEKLGFYAALGVPEVWIVGRDTKESQILVLRKDTYEPVCPDNAGWVASPSTGIQLRRGDSAKLTMRVGDEEATRLDVPED